MTTELTPPMSDDLEKVAAQLGRTPRGVLTISYRTPDGEPGVVMTAPRLPDGTPFPTLYYLTDPRLVAAASRMEAAGIMKEMTDRLQSSEELKANYLTAHQHYLATRNALEDLGTDFSGGGMPDRVKCLHVLMAYALSEQPGVVLLGDEAVARAAEDNRELRGTAIPAEWPTLEDLGVGNEKGCSACQK